MKKLFNVIIVIIVITIITVFDSCKDSDLSQFKALSKPHLITLYSCNGSVIKQWESTGSVSNETNSDGWYFKDKETGKLIEVTGTLIIEVK